MKKRKNRLLFGLLISVLVFALIVFVGTKLIGSIDHVSEEAETATVENAVRAATLTCYAVEGAYPSGLDYLKTHYGLYFDESIYDVSYNAFAENVFPDITVMVKGGGLQ